MFPHLKMTNWAKFPSSSSELAAFADTPLTKKERTLECITGSKGHPLKIKILH